MEHIKALYHLIVAVLAIIRHRYPARNLFVIAVTGTSGKTTTAHLIYSILKDAGERVSLISSVTTIVKGEISDTGLHVTTPGHFSMQKILSQVALKGDKYVVIEASSHGIAQYRMLGTNVRIGVLTNIAHEHLDWHKTFAAYAKAKLSLVAGSKIAVVNAADISYKMLKDYRPLKAKIISYSLKKDYNTDFTPENLPTKSNLPGDFNKYNILAAGTVARIIGIDNKAIARSLQNFSGIVGRFEEIQNYRNFRIIVDFAHKPNAIEELLKTLRKMTDKKIIAVFGSAGERDKAKRKMMGEIAGRLADISILTAEDPRSEDVNDIIEEIAQGCLKANAKEGLQKTRNHCFIRIANRSEAINFAINKVAKKNDIVAFLGKSHEKSMCYGKTEYPWSEHDAIYKALGKT